MAEDEIKINVASPYYKKRNKTISCPEEIPGNVLIYD